MEEEDFSIDSPEIHKYLREMDKLIDERGFDEAWEDLEDIMDKIDESR